MLIDLVAIMGVALLSSDAGGALRRPPSSEDARLRAMRRAVRDGMCTSDVEDAAISALGGDFASIYGEITPRGVSTLGTHLGLGPADEFVDCGSGLGRVVVQAAAEFGCRRASGIEYAVSRHELAVAAFGRRDGGDADDLGTRVSFVRGDCADASVWQENGLDASTVAYVSNLLFDQHLNARVKRLLEATPALRAVASLKRFAAPLAGFREPCEVLCETSWSAPLVVVGDGGEQPHAGSPVFVYERDFRRT